MPRSCSSSDMSAAFMQYGAALAGRGAVVARQAGLAGREVAAVPGCNLRQRSSSIGMRVRKMLADVAHVDLPGATGVIVIVDPGGDETLPGYLEMRIHENGAVRMYVPGNREDPQLPEFGCAFDGLGFLGGMRARRIAGPPGRSVAKVGVDSFAEFTAAPRGRVPVEHPQHIP